MRTPPGADPEVLAVIAENRVVQRKKNVIYSTRWNNKNTEKVKADRLMYNHGISVEEWDALFTSQGNVCAVCKGSTPNRAKGGWVVDHCHTTGKRRGILCHKCNVVLGMAKDSVETLRSAIEYLGR